MLIVLYLNAFPLAHSKYTKVYIALQHIEGLVKATDGSAWAKERKKSPPGYEGLNEKVCCAYCTSAHPEQTSITFVFYLAPGCLKSNLMTRAG
ncbi:MAG: hypothetical protein BGO09_06795 [Bacteroidetes bacterium 47-18]|nr:MAG: hypothetical protein BGO09_06795 [Bacteroidetes bacterium 47-18]